MSDRPTSRVHDLALAIVDAVSTYYDDNGIDLPERRGVCAGQPAWDCESLFVWIERTHGHEGNINQETATAIQGHVGSTLRAMQAGITICRCTPDIIDMTDELSGRPKFPSVDSIEEAARVVHYDEVAIIEAIRLGAQNGTLPEANSWSVLEYRVLGPMVGFVASELKVKLGTEWGPTIAGS